MLCALPPIASAIWVAMFPILSITNSLVLGSKVLMVPVNLTLSAIILPCVPPLIVPIVTTAEFMGSIFLLTMLCRAITIWPAITIASIPS